MAIQIISGTNRPGNLSQWVARWYQQTFAGFGLECGLITMEDLPRELIQGELYRERPRTFTPLQHAVDQSGHFLFVAPEYNGSIPGILKLFIDACEYPGSFAGKKAALVGVSAGEGGNGKGMDHLQDIMEYLGATVSPSRVSIPKIREKIQTNGKWMDQGLGEAIEAHVRTLVGDWQLEPASEQFH